MQQRLLTEQRLLQAGEGLSEHVTRITDRWDGAFANGGVDSAQVPRLLQSHRDLGYNMPLKILDGKHKGQYDEAHSVVSAILPLRDESMEFRTG